MKPTLSEILSVRWLIYRQEIVNYFPMFLSYLNGNPVIFEESSDESFLKQIASSSLSVALPSQFENPSLPDNSVAVIPIQGVMYASKTLELINNIRKAESNDSISSMLFLVNTPGGMVFMTDIAAQAIKDSRLPSLAYVMNMAASAGMWLISACNTRWTSSKLDRVGSIGVKTSFTDMNGFLKEKLGITVYDLYATKSVKKDEEVRALLSGDNQPIIDDLDYTNEIFHQFILDNLPVLADSEIFSGAMFNAEKAGDLGMIDAIGTLEAALEETYKLGIISQMKSMIVHH